ncbi:hypothetical protein Bphy_3457 [Paraburkholderia phymatum STM815]|uniref:Uncharacterized protein n=1 Tax=Paraburkholderia phymatum (strain DSM 17167 / CIP 108236 / LMG 21445 / STM815) TaxID=391038 RepID=B2JLH7_PARP8|nr:hypothetical protein Bphy_3457 [Paraburkholderia phymatum STM815]
MEVNESAYYRSTRRRKRSIGFDHCRVIACSRRHPTFNLASTSAQCLTGGEIVPPPDCPPDELLPPEITNVIVVVLELELAL